MIKKQLFLGIYMTIGSFAAGHDFFQANNFRSYFVTNEQIQDSRNRMAGSLIENIKNCLNPDVKYEEMDFNFSAIFDYQHNKEKIDISDFLSSSNNQGYLLYNEGLRSLKNLKSPNLMDKITFKKSSKIKEDFPKERSLLERCFYENFNFNDAISYQDFLNLLQIRDSLYLAFKQVRFDHTRERIVKSLEMLVEERVEDERYRLLQEKFFKPIYEKLKTTLENIARKKELQEEYLNEDVVRLTENYARLLFN